jgi:hypothetical protein
MEINIGGYKMRLEILVVIFVVLWIMFGTTLLGCSDVSLAEGFDGLKQMIKKPKNKPRLRRRPKPLVETFVSANNSAYSPQFSTNQSPGYILPPNTWSMATLEYSKGTTPPTGVQTILDRPMQPLPLPEGQLDFLATTPFKPDCCPSAFSTSTGCACLTMDQYKYLHERGGNNVPFSQY